MSFRIRQALLDSTIYFYEDEASACAGKKAGASGFLFGYQHKESSGCYTLWAVTNRHVIDDGGWTIRLNTKGGSIATIDTSEVEWFKAKEDDLAVRPISLSHDQHEFKFITDEWLLSQADAKLYDIGPGDPCFVIGRFVNHEGIQKNTPTARFGQIAQQPNEMVEVGGFRQESYLVEIRSIGGYSGSPVFVYLDNRYLRNIPHEGPDRHGKKVYTGHFHLGPWLLGIDWCMVPTWERVCDSEGTELKNEWVVPANSGMMGVIPSWRLQALFDSPEVAARRAEIEKAWVLSGLSLGPPPAILTGGPG